MSEKYPLYFYNTLTRKKEKFLPIHDNDVRMYSCGPTVYNTQHIGNMAYAVFVDILRRTLEYNGLTVKHAMNITDFGHLTSDGDDGEDKMTVGLKRDGLELTLENMKILAEKYAKEFLSDIKLLNIHTENMMFPRASEHVEGQIAIIKTLEEKGYTYETSDGVYFETSQFPTYGALGSQSDSNQEENIRVAHNSEKHNQKDFALWKKNEDLGWDSPWGKGFPGWHIECSAMVRSCLGRQIDIHTGGIEHIGVHHNNEIAQSEAATGKSPLSRFWIHRSHIQIEGKKISKSLGNTVYLRQIIDRGFSPLSYRYWLLTASYRTPTNFTWEALDGSQTALKKLHRYFVDELSIPSGLVNRKYQQKFQDFINDDLDTPKAIALLWELVKDDSVSPKDKRATLLNFDTVLGIGLNESNEALTNLLHGDAKKLESSAIPKRVQNWLAKREEARGEKDFETADKLREKIEEKGYILEDTNSSQVILKRKD